MNFSLKTITVILKTSMCLFVLGMLIQLQSCKDKNSPPKIFIDQKTKDYCVFKTGSWWKYHNKSLNVFETISVESYKNEYIYIEEFASVEFQQVSMDLAYESLTGYDDYLLPSVLIYADYNYKVNKGILVEQSPYYFFPNVYWFPFNKVNDKRNLWGNDTLFLQDQLDTLTVNGVLYSEIDVIGTTSPLDNSKLKTIYWAKHIGKIKFETFDGLVWELIESNIIK